MKKTLLLASVAISALCANAEQVFTPIEIKSGFNQDVICENKDDIDNTVTQSPVNGFAGLDGCNFMFYTTAVQEQGALCGADGTFSSTKTGAKFKVNPVGDNALVLKTITPGGAPVDGADIEGDLIFKTPTAAKSIYVIGTGTEGDSNLEITINYNDGTNAVNNITMYNWDSSDAAARAAAVVSGLGRMAGAKNWAGPAGKIDAYAFQLFELAVNTDNTKQIKSVGVKLTTALRCASVLGVTTSNDEVTGIDEISADHGQIINYTTPAGIVLDTPAKGLNIVKYADGTVAKVIF